MISVFELFKIGIGPSSSHTVGPMKAAAAFAHGLAERGAIGRAASVKVTLYGSLAFTGKGHAVDKAVILGLSGEAPATIDPADVEGIVAEVTARKMLTLAGVTGNRFRPASRHHLRFRQHAEAPSQYFALLRARRAGRCPGSTRPGARSAAASSFARTSGADRRRGRRLALSVPLFGRSSGARARERPVDRRC